MRRRAISKSARRQGRTNLQIRGQSCKFQKLVLAMPNYLIGEFNGGCTASDGCREQPLLAATLQEAKGSASGSP